MRAAVTLSKRHPIFEKLAGRRAGQRLGCSYATNMNGWPKAGSLKKAVNDRIWVNWKRSQRSTSFGVTKGLGIVDKA